MEEKKWCFVKTNNIDSDPYVLSPELLIPLNRSKLVFLICLLLLPLLGFFCTTDKGHLSCFLDNAVHKRSLSGHLCPCLAVVVTWSKYGGHHDRRCTNTFIDSNPFEGLEGYGICPVIIQDKLRCRAGSDSWQNPELADCTKKHDIIGIRSGRCI